MKTMFFTAILLLLMTISAQAQGLCGAQTELKAQGYYDGVLDCLDGPQTRSAIRRFQADRGLYVDGTLGEDTRRALYGRPGSREPVSEDLETVGTYITPRDRSQGPKCLDDVVEARGPIGVEALGFAKRAAITVWKSTVGEKYGNQYVEWENATDIQVDCDPACSKCTVRAECTVKARPCRD